MDSTLKSKALEIVRVVDEIKGNDIVLLDMGSCCDWSDYMVIATVTSHTHLIGISERLRRFLPELDLQIFSGANPSKEEIWNLIDTGPIVISLMLKEAREFYSLEDLWFDAERVSISKK